MEKKPVKAVIDSRHLKILAAKRADLRDSIVFICLDESKYGEYDQASLRKIGEQIDAVEPTGVYILTLRKHNINIYDRTQFKNKDLIVTISHENPRDVGAAEKEEIEKKFQSALTGSKSIKFIHAHATVQEA